MLAAHSLSPRRHFGALLVALAVPVVVACEGGQAPPFPEGQGQAPGGSSGYPAGPYGVEKGAVIGNFKLVGLPNPAQDQGESVDIELADFYNPTGDGTFPEGSVHGEGVPKPRVLLVNIGAVWCQPCQYEADVILPVHYEEYAPEGVQFLLVLADGPNVGVPATFNHLVTWTTRYETRWPATIDPSYSVGSLFKANAFPVNIVVDTSTMRIVEAVAGLPEEDGPLFQALDDLTSL